MKMLSIMYLHMDRRCDIFLQGIEEEELSFARELFPKTRQHGLEIGIRLKDDLDLEENDPEEEEGKMVMYKRQEGERKYEGKEEREYEEETSPRESELSSASDSVSLEVCCPVSNTFKTICRCLALAGMKDHPIYLPASWLKVATSPARQIITLAWPA